ncbi:GM12658 [Drosophila sechellia]|uniref:GM12658 n=1 Tax=Drosophila sechellia TaxID=7238 RepID=B4I0T5_DROSE|nr:GM12658 [Drosophila sechellia]
MDKVKMKLSNDGEPRDYPLDEDFHLLRNLGDCHKANLADIDVIARTTTKCQLAGDPIISTGYQRIVTSLDRAPVDEETDSQEEEMELLPYGMGEEGITTDEETKTLIAIQGLDEILKRIDILRSQLRRNLQLEDMSQPSESAGGIQSPCQWPECEANRRIRCIQTFPRHHIPVPTKPNSCAATMRSGNMLRSLGETWTCLERRIADIRGQNLVHLAWTEECANDLSNCQRRHRSLAAVKLTKKMALLVTKTNMSSGFRYSRRYLRHALIARHINDFRYEIAELKVLSEEIFSEIDGRLDQIKMKAERFGVVFSTTPRQSHLIAEGTGNTELTELTDATEAFTVPRSTNPK